MVKVQFHQQQKYGNQGKSGNPLTACLSVDEPAGPIPQPEGEHDEGEERHGRADPSQREGGQQHGEQRQVSLVKQRFHLPRRVLSGEMLSSTVKPLNSCRHF